MTPQVQHRNRHILVDQSRVIANALTETYLTANMAAASGTLTVANVEKFAIGKYVWINPFGETSEIVAVHASSAPSQPTLTLAANTVFAHNTGEKVYYIEFNQVEISHSATLAGSKSVLVTTALEHGSEILTYLDTTQTTGFYFARFKDSIAATFGGYSDGIAYNGWDKDEAGKLIDRALRDVGINLSSIVTLEDCYDWLTEGMEYLKGKLLRWPEHIAYNQVVGQTTRGIQKITMPTDAYDTETNRSVLKVRIGDNSPLTPLDPISFAEKLEGVKTTQVTTQASASDTTLEIDNSYDFADTGSVNVYISGTKYNITYTGVTRSATAGVLTGVPASGDGSITVTIPVDTNVWQDEVEGVPIWHTVRNGSLEYYPLPDANEDNQNVYMDYSKVATAINSDGDTIDFHRYDILRAYLTWRIRCAAKFNGELKMDDGYFMQFKEKLNDAIRTLPTHNKFKQHPKINRMLKRGNGGGYDLQNLPIENQ